MERNDRVITPNIAVAERVAHARPAPVSTESRWWQRWGAHVGYAAVVWSLLYGALGLSWSFGGAGFPFGRGNDPQAALSILADVQVETAAPFVAGLGLLGSAVALATNVWAEYPFSLLFVADCVIALGLLAAIWATAREQVAWRHKTGG